MRSPLAGVTKRVSALVAIAVAAALLTSCASSERAPASTYGNRPAMEEYLDNLGTYEPFVELAAGRQPTKQEYEAIVQSYRAGGLEGLADDDVRVLLAVSQMAFLSYQRTLRYSIVARETGPLDGGGLKGDAVLEEVYVMWNGVRAMVARRLAGRAIEWRRSLAEYNPNAGPERLDIFEVPPETSEVVTEVVWEKSSSGWRCTQQTSYGGYFGLLGLGYEGRFSQLAKGTLLGKDAIDQRAAYPLLLKGDSVQSIPDITYWLDAETLWLRQYEYEEDGIRYTVKLEAVNEDITIEPPDVNVPCVEE